MTGFYALRYLPSVPLRDRKHAATVGRFETYGEAVDALDLRPAKGLLEIVEREVPAPKVVQS